MPGRILSLSPVPSVSLPHWNYFLAIEDDIGRIGRYIELTPANFTTYSIETARLLMTATQEIDVLFKQLCGLKGNGAKDEKAYRLSVPKIYPRITTAKVQLSRYGLNFTPFESWEEGVTPKWWTANNKVKHERHSRFPEASVGNMLDAVSALLLANIYYHHATGTISDLFPGTIHFLPVGMVEGLEMSGLGWVPKYKIL